ncbi:MAG TPA: hypothetical protein VJW20_04555 [Candidatus Angelobacter sp.]|nr:hypothetical protein [Candidatus Angelobacter sp.]
MYNYVRGLPTTRVDLDGHEWWKTALEFAGSAASAWASDNAFGAGRVESNTWAGKLGAAFGDGAATVQGVGETIIGSGGEVLGVALDATGVGALAGVPINVASAGLIAHGVTTTVVGGVHLAKDASQSGGPKAEDAPGVTSNGQATDEHGNKKSGSGEIQIDKTKSTTREGARNKALSEGSGAVLHRTPRRGKRHFHGTRANGTKKVKTHHEF